MAVDRRCKVDMCSQRSRALASEWLKVESTAGILWVMVEATAVVVVEEIIVADEVVLDKSTRAPPSKPEVHCGIR